MNDEYVIHYEVRNDANSDWRRTYTSRIYLDKAIECLRVIESDPNLLLVRLVLAPV